MTRGDVVLARPSLELVVLHVRESVVWAQLLLAGELAGLPFAISRRKFEQIFHGPVRVAPDLVERGVSANLQPEQTLSHGIVYR